MSALLRVEGLAKAYRGLQAVRDVSFTVPAGTIVGIIGPNGSGKSTTIDCISGFQRADAGRVWLDGAEITALAPPAIARAGLTRTFQTVRVYDRMNVRENLLVARQGVDRVGWIDAVLRTARVAAAEAAARARARDMIALVGLAEKAETRAGTLSYGQKKLVALAAAMMAAPKLVVLDEPVAGVNPTRVREVEAIIRKAHALGASFLIIEHNVDFIMRLCARVIVLEQGRVLVEGPPASIQNDPRVLEAYLGGAAKLGA